MTEPGGDTRRQDPLAALVEGCARGDAGATRRLLDELAKPVLRVVRMILGASHPDVDDAAQESLIAIVRAVSSFRHECSAAQYASRIAVRTTMAFRRRARASAARSELTGELDVLPSNASDDPAARTDAEKRSRLWRDLLDDLPEAQAETLALRVLLGHSMEEVAQATGAPLNTVRSRLRLAREALRRRIEGDAALSDAFERKASG